MVRQTVWAAFALFIAAPLMAAIPVSEVEGNSGPTVLSFTITHSPNQPQTTYSWTTVDGGATAADNDYVPTSGSVVLGGNGPFTATIDVTINGDTKFEADELFTLTVTNLQNGPYEITIVNDDPPTVTVTNASVTEGNSGTVAMTFTASLDAPTSTVVTASYQTSGGSATEGADYAPAQGTITFGPGQPSQTITVLVNGDNVVEQDETFTLTVTPAGGGPSSATGTIINDDTPAVTVTDASVTDGNSGTVAMTFTASLVASVGSAVTATYQTGGGTASPGVDYVPAQGTLTFGPDQPSQTITVTVNGDTLVEPNENFTLTVTLNDGSGATALGTIVNDDAVALSVGNATVKEGDAGTASMTFDVSLTQAAAIEVSATYATEAGTATAGQDFLPAQGTAVFAPGETRKTVSVTINGDMLFEGDETLFLNVSAAGATARGTGTILNDDIAPPATIVIVSGNGQQGILGTRLAQPLVVEVRDVRAGPAATTVQWRVTKGTAKLEPSTSATDAQGRASTNVTLESVGSIEIEASVAGLTPVRFTLGSSTSFELRAEGPVAIPVARALDQICARNEETFNAVCRALATLPQVTPALERIAPQPSGAQSKISDEFVSSITSGIRHRLSALRRGTGRVSVQGLSLFHGGRAIPVATLASAFLPQATDAGAPQDEYNGWSAFLSGNLGEGERKARNGQLGFDLETRGVMFGVDRLIGQNAIAGVSVNWMGLDSDLSEGAGSVDTTGYALSVYASRGSGEGMHFDGSLTFGRNNYESEHIVDIAGMPLSRATSENDANVFAVSAGTGFDAHRGRGDFDFAISGTWSRTDIDELAEQGSGPLILFVQGHEIESLVATAGVSARGAWAVPFGTLLPSFRAELVHEFESGARLVTARFVRDTLGTSFTVPIDQPDANYGKLAAGLQAEFGFGYSAFVEVTQDVMRSDLSFRTVQFNLRKAFR